MSVVHSKTMCLSTLFYCYVTYNKRMRRLHPLPLLVVLYLYVTGRATSGFLVEHKELIL